MQLNANNVTEFVNNFWEKSLIPALSEFIKIPCKSVLFDRDWEKTGHLANAATHIINWARQQGVKGLKTELLKLPGFAPLIFMEIDGQTNESVLFYGHYDKMPENIGWDADLDPWKPVIKNGKLFGRGAVDDGYAAFVAIAAIKTLQEQNIPHARCVLLIEGAEECHSIGFADYIKKFQEKIGVPNFIIFLDGVCGDYKRFWSTVSSRGAISAILNVGVLSKAEHSGEASGIVPSSFRILRQLLSRIENQNTGKILLKTAHVSIPKYVKNQADKTATILGAGIYESFPWLDGVSPIDADPAKLLLNRAWTSTLCVIGAEGFPSIDDAANALRPFTRMRLSLRIPPRVDPVAFAKELQTTLEINPPYGAQVSCEIVGDPDGGWEAPATKGDWLNKALNTASQIYCQEDCAFIGAGLSIGTLSTLSKAFPKSEFLLTGLIGPGSGCHGPNEFLHIPAAKKLTCGLAHLLAEHAARS